MIRRTCSKRALAVVASVCLLAAFLSAQVHIREKVQIQPTAPPITRAEINTTDNLRFVFEWTPERILGRMFVTGLDNNFNVVVDTFLTDVGGHLEVTAPAVEGEYTFNLQIRTSELLPEENETMKLSIYLNETLLREDTDFVYSFTGTFSVWIPESFIYFADPLHHFSLQLTPNQPSYGEAAVLIVTARDASNSEVTLSGSKTLTLRVVPEEFLSFITVSGDTVGPEQPGISYLIARGGALRIIGNGLIPDPFPVFGILSAELEENTSKTGQLEFDVDIPCVETNLSSTTAQPGDTVTVSFLYTRTDGSTGYFRPDQQFSVFIADNDSMGLLYSSDGQIGPDLFGAIQPLYYIAPDSLSGDSLIVQFLVSPVSSGGAASAALAPDPVMGEVNSKPRIPLQLSSAMLQQECEIAQIVIRHAQDNRPPEITSVTLSPNRKFYQLGSQVNISATAIDPDGDSVTIQILPGENLTLVNPGTVVITTIATDSKGATGVERDTIYVVGALIEPDVNSVLDGNQAGFAIVIIPEEFVPSSFRWSWRAKNEPAGNNPNVEFHPSDTIQNVTIDTAKWYAYPDDPCEADIICLYQIRGTVVFGADTIGATSAELEVRLPNVPGVTWAEVEGLPQIGTITLPSGAIVRYKIAGPGNLARVVKQKIILSPPSQFHTKTVAHEEIHAEQLSTGILNGHLLLEKFFQRIMNLDAISEPELLKMIQKEKIDFAKAERKKNDALWKLAEKEAYAVSDTIPPFYFSYDCVVP